MVTRPESSRRRPGRPSLAPGSGPNGRLSAGLSREAPDRASSGLGMAPATNPHEERGLRESEATQQVSVDVWSRRAHIGGMKSTVTVRYQDHKSGSVKEKSFKSQAAYEKWLEKADVSVLAYEDSK